MDMIVIGVVGREYWWMESCVRGRFWDGDNGRRGEGRKRSLGVDK
jgi:hypothetical protein